MAQNDLIESLKGKIEQMIADNRRLRVQAVKQRQAEDKLKADKTALQQRAVELERRVGVLELAASMSGNAERRKLARARVNRLMREVDRCMALIDK